MSGPPTLPRYRYIDSLRAIAAYVVIWMHVSEFHVRAWKECAANGTTLYDVARLIDAGRIGVVAFFIISGFVIPSSLRGAKLAGARKFVIRRFWRLYPAYWLAVVLGYFAVRWLYNMPQSGATILANFTMVQGALGYESVMGHFWTLETELFFYALCLVFFLVGLLKRPLWLVVLIMLFTWISRQFQDGAFGVWKYPFPFLFLHLAIMYWGAIFRMWDDGGRRRKDWKLAALLFTAYVILEHPAASVVWGLDQGSDDAIRFGLSYLFGFALYGLGVTVLRIESRFFAYLGEISYSLYLFHPVTFYLGAWAMTRPGAPEWLRSQHVFVYLVWYAVLSTLLAAAIYRWVEKPAIDLAHRWTREKVAGAI